MRSCLLFLIAVPILALGSPLAPEHPDRYKGTSDCKSQPGDVVLTILQVSDPGHTAGKGHIEVVYPPDDQPQDNVINCVEIEDLKPDLGATAEITSGHPGGTSFAMALDSKFRKGMSFSIKISGQPKSSA